MSTQNPTLTKPERALKYAPPLFTRPQLRWMAVVALAVLLLVCLFLVLVPRQYDHEAVRFAVCVLLTMCLAIFFFIFWPQELKLTKLPGINLSVSVAGPVVLWLVLFPFLLYWMPPCEKPAHEERSHLEYFALSPETARSAVPFHTGVKLLKKDGKGPVFYPVADPGDASALKGVVVEFAPGEDLIRATLQVPNYPPLFVEFRRGAGTAAVSETPKE
jgi:hypothetical protein